jgi:hypothetical protein
MDVNTKLNIEEENENINNENNDNQYIKKNKNNIFCNPVHGKNGQDKQLEEIRENNKILNEFINDMFHYFWGFFDKPK